MRRWWLRVGLVIVMLTVAVVSGYQIVLTERQISNEREAERAFTALAWKLTLSLSELRGAQQAYVAAGQDRRYWVDRVGGHLDTIATNLGSLTRLARQPSTTAALADASAAMDDLRRMDALAREHTEAGQDLIASDLIFTDGLELAQKAASHVELGRIAERSSHDSFMQTHRNAQVVGVSAATGTGVLVALMLLPAGRVKSAAASENAAETSPPVEAAEDSDPLPSLPAGRLLLDLDLDTDRLSMDETLGSEIANVLESAPAPAAAEFSGVTPDLQMAASLCTDLGRMASTVELPALLERASTLLNASGIIVWMLDASGNALQPAAGHGYPARTLARMGKIVCDGDNATAAAFRDVQMQVVPGDGTSGALVAPLLSPTSCVGVMSAELQQGWETSAAVQATASIIAAQLATLVAADKPVETRHASTGA